MVPMVAVISCGGTIHDISLTGLSIISQDLLCDSPSFPSHQSTSVVGTCFISETAGAMKSYCVLRELLTVSRLQLSLMPITLPDDALSLSKDKHHEHLLCDNHLEDLKYAGAVLSPQTQLVT